MASKYQEVCSAMRGAKVSNIDNDTQFMQSEQIVSCEFEGGKALLDLNASEYFKINNTAAFVWESISEPITINQLSNLMLEKFDVEEERLRADISAIISNLYQANLIREFESTDT